MHKCMTVKHLMHEESYKDRNTIPHPNGIIVWNECLMRSETRVGRMRTRNAHKQGVKSIKHFL